MPRILPSAEAGGEVRARRSESRTCTTVCRASSPGKPSGSIDAVMAMGPGLAGRMTNADSASPQAGMSMAWDWRAPSASSVSWVRTGSAEKFSTRVSSVRSWPTTGSAGCGMRRLTATLGGVVVATHWARTTMFAGSRGAKSRQAVAWKSEITTNSRCPPTLASWRSAKSNAALRAPASGTGRACCNRSVRKSRFGAGSGKAASGSASILMRLALSGLDCSRKRVAWAQAESKRLPAPSRAAIEAERSMSRMTVDFSPGRAADLAMSTGQLKAAARAQSASVRSASSSQSLGRRMRAVLRSTRRRNSTLENR